MLIKKGKDPLDAATSYRPLYARSSRKTPQETTETSSQRSCAIPPFHNQPSLGGSRCCYINREGNHFSHLNKVTSKISWMEHCGLRLADFKAEIVLSHETTCRYCHLEVGNATIQAKNAVKYISAVSSNDNFTRWLFNAHNVALPKKDYIAYHQLFRLVRRYCAI